MKAVLKRIWYGPPEWIVAHFPTKDRRAFGFWIVIFAVIGAFFFGSEVLYVTVLSVVALIPNFTTETPVEEESE